MSTARRKDEEFNFSFLGCKLNTTNPGWKSILLLVLIITGLILVFRFLPTMATGGAILNGGKEIARAVRNRLSG